MTSSQHCTLSTTRTKSWHSAKKDNIPHPLYNYTHTTPPPPHPPHKTTLLYRLTGTATPPCWTGQQRPQNDSSPTAAEKKNQHIPVSSTHTHTHTPVSSTHTQEGKGWMTGSKLQKKWSARKRGERDGWSTVCGLAVPYSLADHKVRMRRRSWRMEQEEERGWGQRTEEVCWSVTSVVAYCLSASCSGWWRRWRGSGGGG